MSKLGLGCLVACALLMPQEGNAQVFPQRTYPVLTDPATAGRQVNGEPIYFDGQFYYPTGPIRFYDPNVIVRTGTYQGVAVYSDSTLEPWSIIYLPIGGTSLRPYERLRSGELGGTTGSRTPSFPVQGSVNSPWLSSVGGPLLSTAEPQAPAAPVTGSTQTPQAPRHVTITMIPAPTGDSGLWVEFDSTRWYHEGDSVLLETDRFDQVGSYKGFSVYKQKTGDERTIFVQTQRDGSTLARYIKR